MRRFTAFLLTVILTLGIIIWTAPDIVSKVRLGLDLKGGFEVLYEAETLEPGGVVTKEALRRTAKSLEKRVNELGTSEPEIWTEGSNRIRIRIAGSGDEQKVREMLKKTSVLTVRGPDGQVELNGSDFVEGAAKVVFGPQNAGIQVAVKDKDKLREISTRLLNQPIYIYLDDTMLASPTVLAVMSNGLSNIQGAYTYEAAKELADTINLGALPLKLTEKYTQSVGATLGQQSLEQTVKAGMIGSLLILVFMVALYRIPGLVAVITLITYTWLLLLVSNLMQATLTLPGIAAFVLGIGMAVDANIITYERLKEELRKGKSLLSAVQAGAKNSYRTIMDANFTAIIAAIVLFYIGTGAIKGFAITLIMSILLSIATNMYFSQWLLRMLVGSGLIRSTGYFGLQADNAKPSRYESIDYVGRRGLFFRLSIAVTVLGIASLLIQNFNFGVDFKAGTTLDIALGQPIGKADAEAIVQGTGLEPSSITVGGTGQDRVALRFDRILAPDGSETERIMDAFRTDFGDGIGKEENTVDPALANELGIKAIVAILVASLGVYLYVSFRFGWMFAVAAILALLHDAFFVISVFSVFRLEVNLPLIAALLTIIGYSINDTIVIFDRIREELRFARARTFEDFCHVVNRSIGRTMSRSINTVVSVMFTSVALMIWGSESIALFSLAMTLGLAIGMYSSVFIASQIWLELKRKQLQQEAAAIPAA